MPEVCLSTGHPCEMCAREHRCKTTRRDIGVNILKEAHSAFGSRRAEVPTAPELTPYGKSRLRFWASILADIAKKLKAEAQEANGMGLEELGTWLIRLQLSVEETGEWGEALASGDIVKIASELMDMTWVTDGHHVALGTADLKLAMYGELQRSNYSKLVDGKPLISEAGRWMKGPDFTPADMGPILAQETS